MRLKQFIFKVILATLIALLPLSLVNYIVDPYQFYRQPEFYKPIYFNDQRYQNPGLARSQDYSFAIIGTSMTDNFLPSYVTKILDSKTVKLSMMGASIFEEKLMVDVVTKAKKADTILLELNYFSFRGDTKRVTETGKGFPHYLYKKGIVSDLKYICNPEILLKSYQVLLKHYKNKSHYTMVENLEELNTWYYNSKFAKENAIKDWNLAQNDVKRADPEEFKWEYLKANADKNIIEQLKRNPQTEFLLFYPPFSILAHEFLDKRGLFQDEIRLKAYIFEECKELENVKIYDFQDIEEITHNLDNYRDMTHYSIHINEYIIKAIANQEHMVNGNNIDIKLENLKNQVREYVVEN